MVKRLKKLHKNNSGLSLIEILVTIAIIAIITTPLVNSFINAMQVNSRARIIQDGTAAAQDLAELFKVFDVESLIASYEDTGVTVTHDATSGEYLFQNIPAEGANGQDFMLDVKLDPSTYSASGESEKIDVNDVNMPVFSGLFGSDCIMLYRQYAGFDEQLTALFAGTSVDPTIVARMDYDDAVRSLIKKQSDVKIRCTYNSETGKYNYEVKIDIVYTYNDAVPVSVTKTMQKAYEGNEIHTIYMICPIFDRYSTAQAFGEYFYNTDRINITYEYVGDADKEHDIYFYIAEQDMNNIGYDDTKQERINPRNVYVNGRQYTEYVEYYYDTSKLKLYTNIGDNDSSFNSPYDLTYGDYNTGIALYEMVITVKEKDSNDVVTTFTTTK